MSLCFWDLTEGVGRCGRARRGDSPGTPAALYLHAERLCGILFDGRRSATDSVQRIWVTQKILGSKGNIRFILAMRSRLWSRPAWVSSGGSSRWNVTPAANL